MSSIEWTDVTWNPVRGCSLVSAGCAHCYAMKQAHRFSGAGKPYEGLTELGPQGPRWTGRIRLVPGFLEEPLHWKKPRRVFVNSMSDLFHEDVPDEFIDRVFAVMADAGRHTFQVLTKRPERMLRYLSPDNPRYSARRVFDLTKGPAGKFDCDIYWPLENVWLGVSVEDQKAADERIQLLIQTPAAVRFISAEPLLEPVTLRPWLGLTTVNVHDDLAMQRAINARFFAKREAWALHWVIVGGESGPGARPCDVTWIRAIVKQCQAVSVPVFVKQLGSQPRGWCTSRLHGEEPAALYETDHCDLYEASEIARPCSERCHLLLHGKGGDLSEWPEDLRVREWPR